MKLIFFMKKKVSSVPRVGCHRVLYDAILFIVNEQCLFTAVVEFIWCLSFIALHN